MPDFFKPLSEVEWVEQLVCDRYKVKIPKFLADYHNWWGWWEKSRFASMEENLRQGELLFDVGSEVGWISAIYAQFVGAGNMALFEPVPENWRNLKATWERNGLTIPRLTACGLLSNEEKLSFVCNDRAWPAEADGELLIESVKYRHIDENSHNSPQTTIDRLVEHGAFVGGLRPKALTVDVEGAELIVLKGAENTLKEIRPLVWVSLHEGWVNRPGVEPKNKDVHEFMNSLGYDAKLLGVDHEEHVFYTPRGRA
jgi:FkbM family methyltransferase